MWAIDQQSVMSEVLDGEAVIVDFSTGRYHAAASVGATVWLSMLGGQPLDGIMDDVQSSHTGVPDDAEVAVVAFIDSVVEAGLASRVVNDALSTGTRPRSLETDPTPWSVPVLESHDDLADLMLIDPVHDVTARGWPEVPSENS